jgi:GTPase SAR1 family protein
MLVGNKKDLESQVDVSYDEAAQFAEENGLVFVEASAKTGQNVEEAFLRTAQLIAQNVKNGYVLKTCLVALKQWKKTNMHLEHFSDTLWPFLDSHFTRS